MMELVKSFFSKITGDAGTGQERHHDMRIAACALMLEMAIIDGEFSAAEKENILAILKREYQLSDAHASALMATADEELSGSVDLWQFTNLINQHYSTEEKLQIIEIIWRIAYADGRLDKHEDYLIHKMANLLQLSHKQLIDAKLLVINP